MINANTTAAFQPDLAADQIRPTRGIMPMIAGIQNGGGGSSVSLLGLGVIVAVLFGLEHLRPKG